MTGALDSMIRLHRWMLDEKRRSLADLQVFAEKLKDDMTQLDRDLERESDALEDEGTVALAYPTFVAVALERRQKLSDSIANLETEIEAAREEVAEAFRELKRFEAARDSQQAQAKAERARRERINQDELAVGLYRRSRSKSA
ncbi:MAG: flagellar FliJ family protein [Kiloniellales bacterium]|nr:flagellar FliJ family protein [Kiloniellales bacterium]